jgi:membrane-bound ClpP family serine protease
MKNQQALALVVFLLLFLGVGYIGIGWLFPMLGLSATSFYALLVWGVLLFLAMIATSMYSRRTVVGVGILKLLFRAYILSCIRTLLHEFKFAVSLFSNTHKVRALGSRL